jgi:broad specificity polyphosphatase/5'/3'-nucleotidase SurE
MKLETSRKDWLSMLPSISNSQTSDKIFPLLEKMETVLESMDVDIDKNWKPTIKFMTTNLHSSKKDLLKELNENRSWSKQLKEDIVNAIDPTASTTNWNKKKNELIYKGQENVETLTKFYAEFCLIMKKLNLKHLLSIGRYC